MLEVRQNTMHSHSTALRNAHSVLDTCPVGFANIIRAVLLHGTEKLDQGTRDTRAQLQSKTVIENALEAA